MKKLLGTISILGLMAVMGVGIAKAATEAAVTATVTIGEVSVTVTPTSFDYGAMPFGETKESFDVIDESGNHNIKAQVGTVETDLDIKGADTTDWTLASTPGNNQYVHRFGTASDGATRPSSYTALTTSYTDLADKVPINGVRWFGLKIEVPTSGATAQQNVNVTVRATWSG